MATVWIALIMILGIPIVYLFSSVLRFSKTFNVKNDFATFNNTQSILQNQFLYYQTLGQSEKEKFLMRVMRFMSSKEFFIKEGFILTDEMKILISASAIQLTFGLEHFEFDHFSKILIYPKEYFNRLTRKFHKGEVNAAGAIVLSWEHFKQGYSNPEDKINLGLHEMAHALRIDEKLSDKYDEFFARYFEKWWAIACDEFKNMRRGGEHFLREYGKTNQAEFFSVCVEHFFEAPDEFNTRLPEIYKHLCILLNQNPSRVKQEKTELKKNQVVNIASIIFEAKHDNTSTIITAFIALAVVGGIAAVKSKSSYEAISNFGIYFLIIIFFSFLSIFFQKTYTIYANGIGIKPRFKILGEEKIFAFEQIVAVTIYSGKSKSFNLSFLENGKIEQKSFSFGLSSENEQRLGEILMQNKVPVGTEGA